MAFIGISVPWETARLFKSIEVPGDKAKVGKHHITLFYLGKNVSIDALNAAIKATYAVTSKTKPFTVSTSRVTTFPQNDDGVPIICRVDSEPLHELRAALLKTFEKMGVPFNNKYPDYKPHVTLSYAEEPIEERRITTLTWAAHEIVLWGGDSEDTRLIVHFPLSMESERLVTKVAARYEAQLAI